jgi:hypothetical protein
VAGRGLIRPLKSKPDRPLAEALQEDAMAKLTRNVKGLMNRPVRMGFMTVPLWVVGAVYLFKKLRDRRRYAY